ncbi:2-iminoacetate synthase ThiH [Haliovirga abyssi]|uniref:Thiamine biosynthesis protein ThiH n=1 Tax=Haliovirga abyssi TaxID=2996794 RepID=A0AAU9DKU2_9FUSO|nr:2-iminoacetate synthase ThiH [Haliovirga abyssi]BDU51554.1 thiamine biosynthesis protein ThiH [Haliovirga abyssi]
MSFFNVLKNFNEFNFNEYFEQVTEKMVLDSLVKKELDYYDFLNLLSPKAENNLEMIAKKAHDITVQNFGYTINLYLPMYLSNYCSSDCLYCGFSKNNHITRKKLTLDEVEKEAIEISKTGIKHILILTGESKEITPINYTIKVVEILKRYFSFVGIEMFPMDEDDYAKLFEAGVDGLTVYQEVYNKEIYEKVHISGEKRDYNYRLETPERGAKAGFRNINIGNLFGLGDIKSEAFFSGIHAKYLTDKYLDTEFGLSLPRINRAEGGFKPFSHLNDISFVQIMSAYRLFLPKVEINISTREKPEFRDNLLNICATKFSAGSKTEVGGYTLAKTEPQFEISDNRNTEEIIKKIKDMGYQPILKNWEMI